MDISLLLLVDLAEYSATNSPFTSHNHIHMLFFLILLEIFRTNKVIERGGVNQ